MDPFTVATSVSAGLNLFGGHMAAQSQANANEMTKGMTHEQMEFQKYMSNTAHQREVEDLRKAGLNPILSANAGASTPNGASMTASPEIKDNIFQSAISNAIELQTMKNNLQKQKSEIGLLESQKRKTDMEERVMQKGLPEAEAKSSLWDAFKYKFFDAIKGGVRQPEDNWYRDMKMKDFDERVKGKSNKNDWSGSSGRVP